MKSHVREYRHNISTRNALIHWPEKIFEVIYIDISELSTEKIGEKRLG